MLLDDIPLFGALRQKLSYLDQRQKLVAQNVANADTPGFKPSDLAPFTLKNQTQQAVQAAGSLGATRSQPGHMEGRPAAAPSAYKTVKAPDSEVTLDGNAVSLEDQMMKMTEARMDFGAAVGFYQKAMNLIQMATRAPGK